MFKKVITTLRSPFPFSYKLQILAQLLKGFQFRVYDTHITSNILGNELKAYRKESVRFLFDEIFLKYTYYATLPERPTIVDCGANIGLSILFFKWLYPKSQIIGFEPNPEAFKLLQKNVKHLSGVKIYNLALSDKKGRRTLYSNKPGSFIASTSRSRIPDTKVLKYEVSTVPLSDYLKGTIDLLKIDVEGAEFDIFKDLFSTTSLRSIRNIITEFHVKGVREISQIKKRLSENGFFVQLSELEDSPSPGTYKDCLMRAGVSPFSS